PAHYLSPDCRVDFTTLSVEEVGLDRVRVTGARGARPTNTYKVSATYRDGYWAHGLLTVFGRDAVEKARRGGEIVLERLRRAGFEYARSNIECIGANACVPGVLDAPPLLETVLRISVADPRKEAVERFAKEIAPLVTSGPQGVTGYAAGRPSPRPMFSYWSCLIERDRVHVETRILDA
ncbi:MAG TPA: acyclic terpene utilization AtuA family protein, partial [Candidatus Hydrogenedentes bacterium]|nr:acyclic terpene utilization AtuA family protein [Candidatus Hydrogenedentota bacterium]